MRVKCPSFSFSGNGCCFNAVSHCTSSFQFLTTDLYRSSGGMKSCVDFFLQVQFNYCDVRTYWYLHLANKTKMLTSTLNHQVVHIYAHALVCGGGGGCALKSKYRHMRLYARHYGTRVCRCSTRMQYYTE